MATTAISLVLILASLISITSAEGPDNHGREFIVGFLENQIHTSGPNDVEIFMTTVSNTPSDVNLTTPYYNNAFLEQITVSRGSIYKVLVDYNMRGSGTELAYKTLYITSTEEIVVYCVNKETYSTDAFVAVPVETLGTEYYVMTYIDKPVFLIAGTVDSTSVSITFPSGSATISVSYGGTTYENGDTLIQTLNRFQMLQVQQSTEDFTGTHIVATQPVAVISGNVKVSVPDGSGSSDHLTEMLFPLACWGREFFSYSTPDRGRGDIMRVLAAEASTNVVMTQSGGSTSLTLNAGEFQDYDVDTDDIMSIVSDKGITVGIFSKTFDNDGPNYGDPAFAFLIPAPLFTSDYTYSTIQLPSGDDFNNKLTLIIHENFTEGLRLDEANISVSWISVPGSNGYVQGWIYVSPGSHNIFHTDPSKIFMAIATGTEQFNSYAFSSGQRMTQINLPCTPSSTTAGDILDNDCDGTIDEEILNGIDDDNDGQIDEDLALPPRVNGGWNTWSNWSECSVTCLGSGQQTRTRACDNPAPENNGIYCVGDGTEYQNCDRTTTPCGVWSVWSEWSPCSVTCNDGFQTRDRNCTDIVTGLADTCTAGDYNETQACDVGPLQGVCYNNVSGNCSYCDWGYQGSSCDQCVANYTGCYCEFCRTDLIGYSTNCSTTCYHGFASISGGDQCQCDLNNTHGFWQDDVCSTCLDGFDSPDCLNCANGWVGTDHCTIPCTSGTHASDYDGSTGSDEIVPSFTCLVAGSGTYTAWMGYSSYNSKVVAISVGSNNQVTGASVSDQEIEFRPGYHQYVFTIGPFSLGANIVWTLGNPANGTSYTVTLPTTATTICPVNDTLAKSNLFDVGTINSIGFCQCNNGYYGASCTLECPGGQANPCNGHGPCRVTTGVCICQSRWTTTLYDYELYDEGYISSNSSYDCSQCSVDWYGDDCSTAKLNRFVNGSGFYAAIASSGIITLDGATLELAKPGAYRLLESNLTKIDGYFVPCEGRYDCVTLKEVALTYNNMTFSIAVDANDATSVNSSVDTTSDFPYSYNGQDISVTYTVNDVMRVAITNDIDIVVTNVNGELMTGVTVPANSVVSGLLGNADGDWVNDVSASTQSSYTQADLTATSKATNADTSYRLSASQTHLVQNDASVQLSSGGYALSMNASTTANVSGLSLPTMTQMTFDLWVKIPSTSGTTVDVVSVDTNLGPIDIKVTNGQLSADWGGQSMSTGITVGNDWTHLAVVWDSQDGNLTLETRSQSIVSGVQSELLSGFHNASTITSLTSVAFGGGVTDTDLLVDNFRLYDTARSASQITADYLTYTGSMATNQRMLVLFDEGGNSASFDALINAFGMYSARTGALTDASWDYSSITFNDVTVVRELAAILTDVEAISVCHTEMNKTVFTTYCNGFDAVKQMIMENCISDYVRTNATAIVTLAGSVFAHYCQGVTQVDACEFTGYLDFCTSSAAAGSSSIILFAGAGVGVLALAALAACCCCCLKGIIGRKKIRDDDSDEEEEEEEEELPKEGQPPMPQPTEEVPLPGTPHMPPVQTSMPPAFTASGKAALVSSVALTMKDKPATSLPPEKPFEPLHEGRWTGYGWLPGARPVDGVSSDPPESPDGSDSGISTGGGDGPQAPCSRPPTSTSMRPAPMNRVTTDSSITVSIDSTRQPDPLTPVQGGPRG